MKRKKSAIRGLYPLCCAARLIASSGLLMCVPMLTWAASPFATPDPLDVSVNAAGLITSNWSFEMRAVTSSGLQSLGQPPVTRSVALANLNQQPDGVAQGFGNIPGGGHYRLMLVDSSNSTNINYNFIFSSTEDLCANAIQSSDGNSITNENGRWMEVAVLKVEEGRSSIAIAPPTTRVCTNSRGKLGINILGIEGGRFKLEINTFSENNAPNGSYSKDVLIERPSGST